MSWMKRGQAGAGAGEGAGTQPYASAPQAQPIGNQQTMYPNYQGGNGSAPSQPQPAQAQFWQLPPQQPPHQQLFNHTQHYGQSYPQDYPSNANQYQQPPQTQYNQNYTNQYVSPQQNYQQGYYQNQSVQQNYTQNTATTGTGNADGWEDNWDWGWEENAKKAQSLQHAAQQAPVQQQVYNNANVIDESFVATDSWNWPIDDKKQNKAPTAIPHPRQENIEPATVATHPLESNVPVPEPAQHSIHNQQAEEVKTLCDREVIKERLPNLALGKRFHIENLTPQWSIESQMSQESSDGPQTLSEGTYRSENQSRNSGESPGPNTDTPNYTQPGFDETYTQNSEWSKNSDEPIATEEAGPSIRESQEELSNSLQEMSLGNNHNVVNNRPTYPAVESIGVQENSVSESPLTFSLMNLPPPITGSVSVPTLSMPPPPVTASVLPQQVSLPLVPRQPSSPSLGPAAPPPTQAAPSQPSPTPSPAAPAPSLPPPPNLQNPFQRAGPFSHKSTTKPSSIPTQPFQPQLSGTNLTSPAAVNKVSQGRGPVGFEANLETAPDNSERPDQPQAPFRPMPVPQPIPDNMEVAPQNDRNEYLQTAHLSSGDYAENTDFTRNLPPPGLRRMVVGQQELEYQNLNISGDEPPPGLSRMVPGQQTEAVNAYNQPADNYMDRHVDGQLTDSAATARPFRQADGQQNPDDYPQPAATRASERRPVGFDRMVPGEPSNDEYSQYQVSTYASNEHRVVTGLDRDFPVRIEATPSDVREQNMDGSDYTEPTPRNVIGAREATNDIMTQEFSTPEESQREVTMEGENLQDLSAVSSTDLTYSREHLDGADQNVTDGGTDRNDASDSLDRPATISRKQSLNRVQSSGEESERDRAFRSSPRRDRHKTSRDRDRDRNRERDKESRYSRGDRTDRRYERDDRRRDEKRVDKDRRDRDRARQGEASPDARRPRRSTRSRKHDDDDTDYCSDRERDPRRYREGSYTSKPPRPEGERRYNTVERERRDHRDHRDRRDRDRDRDRYERHYADYRDIDPSRKYGNLHREREEDRRRGDAFSSASRPESRDAPATDEETGARRPPPPRARRPRPRPDPYYDGYGGGYQDPYLVQRQQYEYYEQLRVTDPAAYMQVYKQLMAGRAPYAAGEGYPGLGYEGQERGSVHSGRSSTTGLKGNDTELTTDVSLGLQLDASTVRSERMTPCRFPTAHTKASIGSRDIVLVPAAYPADGAPATVQVLSLAAARAADPAVAELDAPTPLLKGVTHKKSVIEYCMVRVQNAAREGARDVIGYVLVWELLALMLRQNGVVVGSDVAELLMNNCKQYEEAPDDARHDTTDAESSSSPAVDEKAALDRFRELLLYGNRQEALEWAMCNRLWGHALQLAASGERRARAAVAARFLAALPRADPLHTLYCARHAPPAPPPPAARGAWRAHAAVLLANESARPDLDARTIVSFGDSLAARGLPYSAQFCYVSGGVAVAPHPLAPLGAPAAAAAPAPRLTLLLAEPRAATWAQLAPTRAIVATEILEYARSLNADYVIGELQVYKLVAASRLLDAGQYERALAYVEAAARAVTRSPRRYAPALVRALAALADRLKYHDPALSGEAAGGPGGAAAEEGEEGAEGSPRHHRWLDDVQNLAHALQVESASRQATPQHEAHAHEAHAHDAHAHAWGDQVQQYHPAPAEASAEPGASQQYQPSLAPAPLAPLAPLAPESPYLQPTLYVQPSPHSQPDQYPQPEPGAALEGGEPAAAPYQYEDWSRTEETHSQSYGDPWQHSYSYGEGAAGAAEAEGAAARPCISMPGAAPAKPHSYNYDDDGPPGASHQAEREEPPKSSSKDDSKEMKTDSKGRSWIGGILTKLSLRPPNQMILPDDKNPTIVWDAERKRWRDTGGAGAAAEDAEEAPRAPPRPPRARNASPPLQGAAPPAGPVSNIFKMQKGRHIKKSYVDVFNPSGAATRPLPPAAEVLGPPGPPAHAHNNYFVPAPAEGEKLPNGH